MSSLFNRLYSALKNRLPFLSAIRFPETKVLLAMLLMAGSLWAFLEIADEVTEQESHAFDNKVLLAFRDPVDVSRPVGPHWMLEAARDVTALGGGAVITLCTLAALGFLALRRRYSLMLLTVVSIFGGGVVSALLKNIFARDRPTVVTHLVPVESMSFPSGHSMLSAVTLLTLGGLLSRVMPGRREKAYIMTLAITLSGLIGLSRIYLGVHYPTDVMAGWCVGVLWALLCTGVAQWVQHRRRLGGGDAV